MYENFNVIFWYKNTFLLFSGIILFTFSILWTVLENYDELIILQEKLEISSLPNWMLLVGVIKTIAAYSGYFYAINRRKPFFFINLILIIMGLGAGTRTYQRLRNSYDTIQYTLSMEFRDQIHYYYKYGKMGSLDAIQKSFKCCGWRNPMDYEIAYIPKSCCKNDTDEQFCTISNVYEESCLISVSHYFIQTLYIAEILFRLSIIIDMGCFLIAILLYHLIYKRSDYAKND